MERGGDRQEEEIHSKQGIDRGLGIYRMRGDIQGAEDTHGEGIDRKRGCREGGTQGS